MLLLIAATCPFIRRFGRGFEKQHTDYEQVRAQKIADNVPPTFITKFESTENVDDLKKRHEVELEEFLTNSPKSRTRTTRTVRISKNKNLIN